MIRFGMRERSSSGVRYFGSHKAGQSCGMQGLYNLRIICLLGLTSYYSIISLDLKLPAYMMMDVRGRVALEHTVVWMGQRRR